MKESPLLPAGEVILGDRIYKRFVAAKLFPKRILEVQLVYEILENEILMERIEQKSFAGMIDRIAIHALLEDADFELEKEFGNYQRDSFHEGDDVLIIQAVRRK